MGLFNKNDRRNDLNYKDEIAKFREYQKYMNIQSNRIINKKQKIEPIDEKIINESYNVEKKDGNRYIEPRDKNLKKDFIAFRNVKKEYVNGETMIKALDDINFSIDEGELVIVLGESGAGKSTMLNALGGMDTITSGEIKVDDKIISNLTLDQLTNYRRDDIGFVFQFYNLMQTLTVKENVDLACEVCSHPIDSKELLEKVGLLHRLNNFPSQISGGEQQRASIARALAKRPKILLCDEPTGALDYKTGKQILKLLQDTCRKEKITVVIITHNNATAPMGDKIISFRSGKITNVKNNESACNVDYIEW